MDIIVLLKQVPATETGITIAFDGKRINPDGVKWVMNPFDEFAVEEALRLKEAHGGMVTLLSLGTDKTADAIRTGFAMGADKGILINDPAAADCDGLGTARVLAAAVKSLPYDVIVAGQRAMDDDNYLVGAAVAEFLGIPHISMVIQEEITEGAIRCRRTIEGGTVVLEAPLPALFTTQRGLNEPRYTSLPGIMKAKKKPIETRTLADLGLSPTDIAPVVEIIEMKTPPERTGGQIIDGGSAAEKAEKLVKLLQEKAKVI